MQFEVDLTFQCLAAKKMTKFTLFYSSLHLLKQLPKPRNSTVTSANNQQNPETTGDGPFWLLALVTAQLQTLLGVAAACSAALLCYQGR